MGKTGTEDILAEIRVLREENRELRVMMSRALELLERGNRAPLLGMPSRADAPVDADYFARVTGLARVTILQGKAGTREAPRMSKRPSRWRKGDVDRWVRDRAAKFEPPRQKALRLLERRASLNGPK